MIFSVDFIWNSRYNYIVWDFVRFSLKRDFEKGLTAQISKNPRLLTDAKKGMIFYGSNDKKRSKRRGVSPVV